MKNENENLRPCDPFDALSAVRDVQLEEITAEVKALVRKHSKATSNEVIATIAWEAFADSCEAWDIRNAASAFADFFPLYAEIANV